MMSKNRCSIIKYLFFIISGLFLIPSLTVAQQQSSDDLFSALQDNFKKEYFSVSTLLQVQGTFYFDPILPLNTYRIGTARFGISGNLDNGVSYKLLTDMARSPVLLDASATYHFSDGFSVTAGAQKPGISAGYLLSAAQTDFINRPRISGALAGNRDIGLLGKLKLTDVLSLWAGMFNGTNQDLENNNNTFYYTGRLIWSWEIGSDGNLQIGANMAHSIEDGTPIGNGSLPVIEGKRTVAGADFRFTSSRFLLAAEYLYSGFRYNSGSVAGQADNLSGYYLTAGYNILENMQFLARYDHVNSDVITFDFNKDLIVLGVNYSLSQVASFTFNYLTRESSLFGNHAILLQTQIAF